MPAGKAAQSVVDFCPLALKLCHAPDFAMQLFLYCNQGQNS